MTENRRQEIENATYRFLEEQNAVSFPIDVNAIAKKLGFKVERMDFGDEKITGMILVNDNEPIPNVDTQRFIGINAQLNGERTRFILAHELGHFKLHKEKNMPLLAYRCTDERNETPEEEEAELYARALLMPRRSIEAAASMYRESDELLNVYNTMTEFISRIFKVSEKKAYERLRELALLS